MRAGFLTICCLLMSATARAQDPTFFYNTSPTTTTEPHPDPVAAPTEPDLPEPPAPPFGARGQVVVTNESNLSISYTHYDSDASFLYFTAAPAIDWFVIRNVSIGISAGVTYGDTKGFGADDSIIHIRSTAGFVGPEVGVNVPIGRWLSFWPRGTVGITFSHADRSLVSGGSFSVPSPVDAQSPTVVGPWVSLFAPLLFHPTQHFFLGFGPSILHTFGRVTGGTDEGAERTTISAHLLVGTHVGGEAPASPPEVTTRERRFGDHHDVVLTGASDISAYWSSYQGTSSSSTSFAFSPGVDVFVGYRIALGASLDITYGESRGIDAATKLPVTSTADGIAGGPRIAYAIPLGSRFTLYPRARISFGHRWHDLASGSAHNKYGELVITTGLFVPVLFHIAPHAFFGAGPTLAYDVVHQDEFPGTTRDNKEAAIGGSWIVGGWL